MSQYFPKLYEHSVGNIRVELFIFNYALKVNLNLSTLI